MKIISESLQKNRLQWLHDSYAGQLKKEGPYACQWGDVLSLDPTPNKKYLDWVLRLIIEEKLLAEDRYKVPAALNELVRCRSMLRRDGRSTDINSYNTLTALFEVLHPYEEKKSYAQMCKEERAEIDCQTEFIVDTEDLLVVSPKTEKASCFWGRGTKWCTAATESRNAFSQYTDKNGDGLYVFIDKKNQGLKYQLSACGTLANELDVTLSPSNEQSARLFSLSKATHEGLDLAFVHHNPKNLVFLKQEENFLKKALSQNGLALEFVSNPTAEMIDVAIERNPDSLKFVAAQTREMCLVAVRKYGPSLEYVKQQTQEICIEAVREAGIALEHVREQTPAICMAALEHDGMSLRFVRNPTHEMYLAAVTNDGAAVQFIAPERITPEICEAAIRSYPESIRFIKNPSEELVLLAVTLIPRVIKYIGNLNQEMTTSAVGRQGFCIEDIRNPSIDDCLTAIRQDPDSIVAIQDPTYEMCLEAVRLRGRTIAHMENQTRELCLEAVKQDPGALHYIHEQTHEICLAAVTHHPEAFLHVRNKTEEIVKAAGKASPGLQREKKVSTPSI